MKKISTPIVSENSIAHLSEYFQSTRSGTAYLVESFPVLMKRTLAELRGVFTAGELSLIVDVFNGIALTAQLAGQHLYPSCRDAMELDEYDKKWGVKKYELLRKIEETTIYQAACLEIWANGFWYGAAKIDENLDFTAYINQLEEA